MSRELIQAYNAGAKAAAYSLGIKVCPYEFDSILGQEWLAGYREAYANG